MRKQHSAHHAAQHHRVTYSSKGQKVAQVQAVNEVLDLI